MDKNEIINYVMDTPGNTNPNVLRGVLDQISSSKSGGLVVNMMVTEEDSHAYLELMISAEELFDAYITATPITLILNDEGTQSRLGVSVICAHKSSPNDYLFGAATVSIGENSGNVAIEPAVFLADNGNSHPRAQVGVEII